MRPACNPSRLKLPSNRARFALGAKSGQHPRQGRQIIARPLAHQTDLNPVPLEQVLAVIAQQKARLLQLQADALRVDFRGEGDADHGRRGVGVGRYDLQPELAQPPSQPGRNFGDLLKLFRPACPAEGRLQRINQVGGLREGNPALGGVITQIQVARHFGRFRGEVVIVKDHRQAGEGSEGLPAHARGQIDPGQIDRHRSDGTDAIEAELDGSFRANRF